MKIRKKQDSMIVEGEFFRYEFRKETAGFPARIGFSGADQPVLSVTVPLLTAVVDGRKVAPHLARFRPEVRREQGSIRISFDNVGWADDRGRTVDGYRLALSYTLHPDGAAFVKAFFFTETLAPGRLRDFVLRVPFRPHRDDRVNWAFWEFPKSNSAELIQALGGFERNLRPGRARIFPGTVLPFVGFDFGRGDRRDRHVEYFVESFNSLTSDYRNTETAVAWRGNRAEVSWNFQKQPRPVPGRSYQWGNLWGWTLREFPVERRHTPFRIYHHFDNFEKYPAAKTIAQAAGQGCNDADRHLGRGEHGPGHRIAHCQECRPYQERAWHKQTVVRTKAQAQGVRHDQSHERDRTGQRRHRSGDEGPGEIAD